MNQASIVVLGSLNMDTIFRVTALPQGGETILVKDASFSPGGKGANQAIAAARDGHTVTMIGCVGRDANGMALLDNLAAQQVDVSRVIRRDGIATGGAVVSVDDAGENSISVFLGANQTVATPQDVPAADIYLTQLETPVAAADAFFRLARRAGGLCVLNAAPALKEASALFALADIVIVNRVELEFFALRPVSEDQVDICQAARDLLCRTAQTIIVTLGGRGALAVTQDDALSVPAHPAVAVDTTGAGDCYCAILSGALGTGATLSDAMTRAAIGASIAVARPGSSVSFPCRADIDTILGSPHS